MTDQRICLKLLFLHGSGTNADIFQLQSRHLISHLPPHLYEPIFLTAPLDCAPGPGVLPIFEGCEPFRKWISDSSPAEEEAYFCGPGLDSLVEEVKKVGPFVGVVGFSQGAKVAVEVVQRLQRGDDEDGIKVVVAVCGTAPFQGGCGAGIEGGGEDEVVVKRKTGWEESLGKGPVRVQSIHLIGEADPWRKESEKLVELFEEGKRTVMRFQGGHYMPAQDKVNREVVKLIRAACEGA